MHASIKTVAFRGIDTIPVEVQVHLANGLPAMAIVGLADKAVAESRERVRASLASIGLALPPKRIAINLAPADVVKEGAHFDLPIALGLLVAIGSVPRDALDGTLVLGELSLHGGIEPVSGVLPAAMAAVGAGHDLVCPAACGPEAAWASDLGIIAALDLMSLLNHLRGQQHLPAPHPELLPPAHAAPDMADLKGQETARRVLEIAAAGAHNLLMAALVGGGARARPGEISLAHGGVLFLDELAEFAKPALDALRQPLETGQVVVARANHHVTYPARFQLVAAMNPCRCGYLGDPSRACARAPDCGRSYCARVSGPMLDRFDMIIEVPEVSGQLLLDKTPGEASVAVARRVATARDFAAISRPQADPGQGDGFDDPTAQMSEDARRLIELAIEKQSLSARGFHRVLRVARTIADLERHPQIGRQHLAEALAYRAMPLLA